tara:strand:+ start:1620 stop:2480 length:861 start_codon:yes stop_codon:yes gene_type:complete
MKKNEAELVVKILNEALPYIQRFSKKICIVKYGGSAMVEDDLKNSFARDITLMKQVGINVIVVHGGGPQIDEELKKSNIKRNFVDGIRVTNKETIRIVSETLDKIVNKEIVDLIKKNGGNSLGISSEKKDTIIVEKFESKKTDYGYVGSIIDVNTNYLYDLMNSNYIPVIAPLGYDVNGQIYNINADIAACKIASYLSAEKIIFLTDTPGVLDDKKNLFSALNPKEIKKYIDSGIISGGMLPKISASLEAIKNDVKTAHIIDGRIQHSVLLEIFTNEGIGTLVKNG